MINDDWADTLYLPSLFKISGFATVPVPQILYLKSGFHSDSEKVATLSVQASCH